VRASPPGSRSSAAARASANCSSTPCASGSKPSSPQCPANRLLPRRSRYALSRWKGLIRFLDDGRIEIDSTVVERSIHPSDRARPQEPSLRRLRRRRRALGGDCPAHRNLQDE
jgi:hypothetical protein